MHWSSWMSQPGDQDSVELEGFYNTGCTQYNQEPVPTRGSCSLSVWEKTVKKELGKTTGNSKTVSISNSKAVFLSHEVSQCVWTKLVFEPPWSWECCVSGSLSTQQNGLRSQGGCLEYLIYIIIRVSLEKESLTWDSVQFLNHTLAPSGLLKAGCSAVVVHC